MESAMEPVDSPKLEAALLTDIIRFTETVETENGAKAFLAKNDVSYYINISNRARQAVRGMTGGKEVVDEIDREQLDELKKGIVVQVSSNVKDKKKAAANAAATVIKNRKNNTPSVYTNKNAKAPLLPPKPQNVKTTPVQEKNDTKKAVKIMSKTVSTGNTAVKAYNDSGINSAVFKNTCKAFGLALVALGIYLGYKMYPNAKEQFLQAWDNGNPNKERLIALLKGMGACLLVVGIIGCGIYLAMHGFKSGSVENDNSFTYNILNASANIVNGIADYF